MKRNKDKKEKSEERATARSLIQIAETLSDDTLRATVPLYYEGGKGQPELLGSGVLISLGGSRFLVTAGHVLDRASAIQLLAGVPVGLLHVAGEPSRFRSVGATKPEQDRIDVGVMRLAGAPWEILAASNFLTAVDLDLVAPIAASHTYALVAYPVSVNRRALKGNRVSAAAFRLGGIECDRATYEARKIDPSNHVMLGFDKNAVFDANGPRNAPDLYGSSGGGLWRFGRRLRDATERPKLSAIATEWEKKGRHRYVLGTRIQLVMEAVAQKYPVVGRALAEVH